MCLSFYPIINIPHLNPNPKHVLNVSSSSRARKQRQNQQIQSFVIQKKSEKDHYHKPNYQITLLQKDHMIVHANN